MNRIRTAEQIKEAATFIQTQLSVLPQIGLILGSGLGVMAEQIENPVEIRYEAIPYFPVSTVHGHAGVLVCGRIRGKSVIMMKGRFHLYEGYDAATVAFPVNVLKCLGIASLVVTNAAGGINATYTPGDFMLIRDHINLMYRHPLVGRNNDAAGPRFPDMSQAYDRSLLALSRGTAQALGMAIQEGVYVGFTGPSYETPAEIRMLRRLGGDAVGMSTVPEVIAANHCGIKVLGITCISNMAAGVLNQPLSHSEVIETTERVKSEFIRFVEALIENIPTDTERRSAN